MRLPVRKPIPLHLAAAVLGALIFLAAVAAFAYTGTASRYWADDYCYSAVSRYHGLFGSIWEWYRASGNRFTTIFMVSLSEIFGARAISYVPAFVLAVWSAGWWFFFTRLAEALGWVVRSRWWVLLALVQVFFCVLLAPDRLQSVYWRLGALHYTFPLGLMLFNLGWMASRWRSGGSRVFVLASGLLAFFAAGSSETFAAMQAVVMGLALVGGALLARGSWKKNAGLAGGALVGTLLAMVVMMFSPSNAWRQAEMPPPDSLVELVTYTLRYTLDFIWYSLRGQPLPIALFALTVGLVVFMMGGENFPAVSLKTGALIAAVSLLVGFVLVAASFAPSAYAGLLYPAGRALMPGRFAFLAAIGGAAAGAGLAARGLLNPYERRWLMTVAALALLAACLYPVRALGPLSTAARELQTKAQRWDERDAAIRAARDAGVTDVVVWEADVVNSLEELNPRSAFWVNGCASAYYGVNSITAER